LKRSTREVGASEDKRGIVYQAIIAMLPLSLATVPWGILCGALGIDAGLTPWQSQAMSLFVFAGAAQLTAVIMLGAGVDRLSIIGSIFVISSRHILYSFDLRAQVHKLPLKWKIPIAFLLTDEMYVVVKQYMKTNKFSPLYAVIAGLTLYVIWNIATLVGIIAGNQLGDLSSLGLNFAIVAVFVAMTAPELKYFPMMITTLVAGTSAIFLKDSLPEGYIVISSLLGMTAGYIASSKEEL